jgi:thiol-disulfide isomerase/thioredoxin
MRAKKKILPANPQSRRVSASQDDGLHHKMMHGSVFTLFLILLTMPAVSAQSRRVAPGGLSDGAKTTVASSVSSLSVKEMFNEANGYLKQKGAEFDAKKIPFSDRLFKQAKLEQRQLAAKYATMAASRQDVAGEDLYYLGMLHWIAENLDGTVESLRKFVALADAAAERRQTARSIITVVLAKQKKVDEAEAVLSEYLRSEPKKLTERARMEAELAKAFQAQKDFARMAPHAEESYAAAKALLQDATSRARGLDEILDSGMLVFEAFRDAGNQKRADEVLEDMRVTAASVESPSFYYYAVDKKIKYLVDTGRKAEANEFYLVSLINAGKDFAVKSSAADALSRLKKRERHYKLLGETAPEMPSVDQWFPGTVKTLADYRGKVLLLDFWATWCAPCFEAFPSLKEWKQDFASEGFEILGVTRYYGLVNGMRADNPSEIAHLKAFRLKEELPYDFVVARDQSIQNLYGATGLPTAVLIDRKGIVRYIETGTSPTRLDELRQMIVKLMAEK